MMRNGRRGFTVIEILIVMVVIAIVAAIAVPGLISSQRASYERNASTSLKTLCVAEADFKTNDRDGNQVNDYWTGDVKGLYTLTNCAVSGNTDPPIKMIDISIAGADTDNTVPPAGGENTNVTTYIVQAAKGGYWYSALTLDNSVSGTAEATYRQDIGGITPMGTVHNLIRYGFMAFPDSSSFGRFVYIVNESNAVFRSATTGTVRIGTSMPPGPAGVNSALLNWPDDNTLKSYWSKLD
jgi:prepilin-type N-terminal cleavage/methylation domain-containing protein